MTLRLTPPAVRLSQPARWWAIGSALALSVGLGLAGVSDRLGRLAANANTAGFRVRLPSGEPVVRRHRPVVLAAVLVPARPDGPVPAAADLITRPAGGGTETRTPMTGDAAAAFTAAAPAGATAADFDYCVETGGTRTLWQRVRVGDPVSFAGCRIRTTPPAYAAATVPPAESLKWGDLTGLPGSTVTVEATCDRPPDGAALEWAGPTGGRRGFPAVVTDCTVRATFELPPAGVLTLTLTAEPALGEPYTAAVTPTPDTPPEFVRAAGPLPAAGEVLTARPGDALPLEVRIDDDVAVASVAVEYAGPMDGVGRSVPLALACLGTRSVAGMVALPLVGRAGDGVRFRLAATDGRPDPQRRTLPAAGWYSVRLDPSARPLAEQAVLADRDRLRDIATLARAEIQAGRVALVPVLAEPTGVDWPPEHDTRLHTAAGHARAAETILARIGAELPTGPALRGVVGTAPAAAMATAATHLTHALTLTDDRPPLVRIADAALAAADAELAGRLGRLDALARDRLDLTHLRGIAAAQAALNAATGPPADLATRQRAVRAELAGVVGPSDLIRRAGIAADRARLRSRASRLSALAAEFDTLARSAARWQREWRDAHARPVAGPQRAVTAAARELAASTASAARLAGATPLPMAAFDRAAADTAEARLLEALVAQEGAAAEADGLAGRIGAAADARADRREAVRQLARWQADLQRRSGAPSPALAAEQATLTKVFDAMTLTSAYWPAEAEAVRSPLREAAKTFGPLTTSRAAESLNKLVIATPSTEERRRAAWTAAEALRQDFERAGPTSELGDRLARIDVLDSVPRRDWAVVALAAAAEARRTGDDPGPAAADARRQLAALALELTGGRPIDAVVLGLAVRAREIAGRLNAGADRRAVQQEAADLARQIAAISRTPEAAVTPLLVAAAVERVEALARVLKEPPGVADAPATAAAVEALGRLTRRLTGDESTADIVQRIRAEVAATPKADRPRLFRAAADELDAAPAGPAHTLRRAAVDALRRPWVDADISLAALAAALDRLPVRVGPARLVGPPAVAESVALVGLDGAGFLPDHATAERLRALARRQREVRGAAAAALAQMNRPPAAISADATGPAAERIRLAHRLADWTARMTALADEMAAGQPPDTPATAADLLRKAAQGATATLNDAVAADEVRDGLQRAGGELGRTLAELGAERSAEAELAAAGAALQAADTAMRAGTQAHAAGTSAGDFGREAARAVALAADKLGEAVGR